MPQARVDLLAAHMKSRRLTAADGHGYTFVGSRGRPLQYSAFRQRVWLPACQQIGIPDVGLHDLRRTNATEMVRRGVDVKTARVRLGHADPRCDGLEGLRWGGPIVNEGYAEEGSQVRKVR